MVYITDGLLEVLLDWAEERDPVSVKIGLAVSNAAEFEDLDLPDQIPIFTTFYHPDAGRSVEAVFGSDLPVPAGQTPGLFVSHPNGFQSLTRRDDLREVIILAVPPWARDSVSVFGRDGSRKELNILDADPPRENSAHNL